MRGTNAIIALVCAAATTCVTAAQPPACLQAAMASLPNRDPSALCGASAARVRELLRGSCVSQAEQQSALDSINEGCSGAGSASTQLGSAKNQQAQIGSPFGAESKPSNNADTRPNFKSALDATSCKSSSFCTGAGAIGSKSASEIGQVTSGSAGFIPPYSLGESIGSAPSTDAIVSTKSGVIGSKDTASGKLGAKNLSGKSGASRRESELGGAIVGLVVAAAVTVMAF